MRIRHALLPPLAALATSAFADRACLKCHLRWPDRYVTCPMDGAPTKRIGTDSARGSNSSGFDRSFDRGIRAFKAEQFAKAVLSFSKAVELRPRSAPATFWWARSLIHQNSMTVGAQAEALLRRAIRLDPTYGPPHDNLGDVLRDRGDKIGAEREYRTAIRHDPSYGVAHDSLAGLYSDRGDDTGAEREYRKAISVSPEYAWGHHHLANVLEGRSDYAGAEREYRKAIALSPNTAWHHFELGDLLWKKSKDYAGAEIEFRKALKVFPKFEDASIALGEMLKEKAKKD